MPTPTHLTSIAQQIRSRRASGADADWLSGIIETADGNTAEAYTVLLAGTAGVVPATSSIDEPLDVGGMVWVTRVGAKYVIVGLQ
jgi:hypothetical protein